MSRGVAASGSRQRRRRSTVPNRADVRHATDAGQEAKATQRGNATRDFHKNLAGAWKTEGEVTFGSLDWKGARHLVTALSAGPLP